MLTISCGLLEHDNKMGLRLNITYPLRDVYDCLYINTMWDVLNQKLFTIV